MNKLSIAVCSLLLVAGPAVVAAPFQFPHRSVSTSEQFIVYCDDLAMRLTVSSFAEETKSGILAALGQQDHWKIPVVIDIARKDATQPWQPVSQVHLDSVEGGAMKVELNVVLGDDPASARFQQQLVRAILLAMEYRDKPPLAGNAPYVDPPRWLVEGMTAYLRDRNSPAGEDVDVYKALLEKNHLPAIGDFLSQDPQEMDAASVKLYQAYAFSFLQLLMGLPNGHACLGAHVADMPLGKDAPAVDLIKHFPPLGGSEETLEKWWTLSLANISGSDRYKGLTPEETGQRLDTMLKISIPVPGKKEPKVFSIQDFKEYLKLPQTRAVLAGTASVFQRLTAQANPLYRPITGEYQSIATELQRGRTRHLEERLKNVAKYRALITTRLGQVADYLNWFEATQMVNRSDSFDDYMKTADQLSNDTPKRDDAISRYLDAVELQLQ